MPIHPLSRFNILSIAVWFDVPIYEYNGLLLPIACCAKSVRDIHVCLKVPEGWFVVSIRKDSGGQGFTELIATYYIGLLVSAFLNSSARTNTRSFITNVA